MQLPFVQRQTAKYNLCGPLVCSFMADIMEARSPEGALYCKEEDQHRWLLDVLSQDQLQACPKKGSGRRANQPFTIAKNDEIITLADAALYRLTLSRGPIRRISSMRDVQKPTKN